MKKLKIAMLAPPWLNMPPTGYGGIEYVVHYLAVELKKMGHYVELFTVGDTTTPADKTHWYYEDGQYRHIHKALYDNVAIPLTHIMMALNKIKESGYFDIIHDHNGFVSPTIMAYLDESFPPVLHTLHGPFSTDKLVAKGMPDNRPMYKQLYSAKRVFFNGISKSQLQFAPKEIRGQIMGVVHNSVDLSDYEFNAEKQDFFVNVGRFARDKGQATAARICSELGERLALAGIVAGISTTRQLLLEMANANSPYRSNEDFVYYRDEVLPHLVQGRIEYIGAVNGEDKVKLLGESKGFIFPLDWEEPFGVAVIEALACGTPVIAYKRGSMPEIIKHGYNGFLAKNESEFKDYMKRVGEIDPANCRKSIEEKFSAPMMAKNYVKKYFEVLEKFEIQRALAKTQLSPLPSAYREMAFYEKLKTNLPDA